MTSQEVRQQLNACESQITGTYSNLCDAARNMGSSVVQVASSKATKKILLPLIVSLLGLILFFAGGIILIIVGIVIAYNTNQSATLMKKNIETQVGYLNNTLDSNLKI